jgi:hypothetical protein
MRTGLARSMAVQTVTVRVKPVDEKLWVFTHLESKRWVRVSGTNRASLVVSQDDAQRDLTRGRNAYASSLWWGSPACRGALGIRLRRKG